MNKDLIKTEDITNKYTVTDEFIQCSRDSNGNYNPFYNDIYKTFLELSIILYDIKNNKKNLNKLKECKYNENFIIKYISILKNITKNLFCDILDEFNITNLGINEIKKAKKYIFIWYGKYDPEEINIPKEITIKTIEYELIGTITGNGGHFWASIYYKNLDPELSYYRIDDISGFNYEGDSNMHNSVLYKRKDLKYINNHPLDSQINNLATISQQINNSTRNIDELNKEVLNYKVLSKIIKNKL
jgi:hypothetical protein